MYSLTIDNKTGLKIYMEDSSRENIGFQLQEYTVGDRAQDR
jgi:hypothetical protein